MLESAIYQESLISVAVDEVHLVTQWGTSSNKNHSAFCVWYSPDSPNFNDAIYVISWRFTSSVWNFWPQITDVSLRVLHVAAEANERWLYSQAKPSGVMRG